MWANKFRPQKYMNPTILELRNKGFRITKIREAVVSILSSITKPITASEISSGIYKKDLSANKTTIYRELEFLRKQNMIDEVEFGDGKKRYEINNGHHHHIVCVDCGAVSDINFDVDLAQHEREISKQTDFKILEHTIEFFGLCKKCQSK